MNDVTEAFNSVYDATFRELLRYCLLKAPVEDAHDLLQNVYAKFYRALCRKGTGAIRDPKAYLLTTLRHELASHYRAAAKRQTIPLELVPDAPDDVSVEDLSLDYIAVDDILDRLRTEPESTQRMFVLYYGYGMKLSDIAEETGTTAASVKSKLARVRKKLKTVFGEENQL